jgi:hypothetical protein
MKEPPVDVLSSLLSDQQPSELRQRSETLKYGIPDPEWEIR